MSEIDFLGSVEKRTNQKMQEHRPPQISVSKVFSENRKWRECKVTGKNVSIRSYSACCSFRERVYVYGGYQMLNGSLGDFYSIALDDEQHHFGWEEVVCKGQHPGARSKHSLLATDTHIYLVGGLTGNTHASNDIFHFEPVSCWWTLVQPTGAVLPPLESSACVLLGTQRILVAGGYHEGKGQMSNAVYQYDIASNKIEVLFESMPGGVHCPTPRVGCAVATDDHRLFLFGGKDESVRFNDIWAFDLDSRHYVPLPAAGEEPMVRNGHTMNYSDGRLFVFGGIHDITWELDDLHIYDLKSGRWTTLQQDSPRKLQNKSPNVTLDPEGSSSRKKGSSSKRKNFYDTVGNNLRKPISPNRFGSTYNQEQSNGKESLTRNESPGNSLEEQRRKAFNQKKADMLRNFEVTTSEKEKLLSLETSSQAMRNSLDVIGNPDPTARNNEGRLTEFGKESYSKFLGPLENNSNIVIGKKPCARDGHCATMLGKELIIFGGDRHQMSFNDIYKLDIGLAQKGVQH